MMMKCKNNIGWCGVKMSLTTGWFPWMLSIHRDRKCYVFSGVGNNIRKEGFKVILITVMGPGGICSKNKSWWIIISLFPHYDLSCSALHKSVQEITLLLLLSWVEMLDSQMLESKTQSFCSSINCDEKDKTFLAIKWLLYSHWSI